MKYIKYINLILFAPILLISLTSSAEPSKVLRVLEGDTIQVLLNGKPEKVKLQKVDTPKSVNSHNKQGISLQKTAAEYTKKRLYGRYVNLEFEGEFIGRHGMLLAYVFIGGTNFNLEMVRQGLSPYYTRYGKSRKYDKEFENAENIARDANLGIWSNPDLAEKYLRLKSEWNRNRTDKIQTETQKKVPVYHGSISSKRFHKPSCRYFFCKDCKVVFHSRDEALAAGYLPCKECKP